MDREAIVKSIYEVINKTSNLPLENLNAKLTFGTSKYSSTKENIWHVEINGNTIKKTSDLLIKYKCVTCNTNNAVSSTQFVRKVNKCSLGCPSCNIIKLNSIKYDRSVKNKNKNKNKVVETNIKEKPTLRQIYENSIIEFNNYPEEFKNSYLSIHLTDNEYNRIKPKIISFCNGNKPDINNYEFWNIYSVNNQQKFTSVIYDKINNAIFKSDQPILKCDNCNNEWRAKNIEQFKNCYKILCATCKVCNKTFKIRSMDNLIGEKIIYQSKLELKFIKWCEQNGIILNNGPNIVYDFSNSTNESKHTYRVDFRIDNILIEIKDNHIWHKEQIKSGKWDAKYNAANKYIVDNNLKKFYFITPINWNQQLNVLIKDISPISKINNVLDV